MNKQNREIEHKKIVDKYAAGGAAKVRKDVCTPSGKPIKNK